MKNPTLRPDSPGQALDGLLVHIRGESARECAAIEAQAAEAAHAILHDARSRARQNVRIAMLAERAELGRRCGLERAAVATRLRHQRQLQSHLALQQAWILLEAELERLWQDPEARRIWLAAALRLAESRLLERPWRLSYPADLAETERDEAAAFVASEDIEWQADAAMRSGLRIGAGGTVLDATPAGLLWQRDQVEGRLLAGINAELQRRGRA